MTPTVPTVQIVDDDPSFLAATSRLLRASGFAVKTFSSASEFLAQLVTDAPGCVVADLQMPGMNGLDLQSALARSRNPLPILFLTGHGDIPSSVVAMRGGAEDFLEKRAPKEKLLDAVRRSLPGMHRNARSAPGSGSYALASTRSPNGSSRYSPTLFRAGSTSRSPAILVSMSAR